MRSSIVLGALLLSMLATARVSATPVRVIATVTYRVFESAPNDLQYSVQLYHIPSGQFRTVGGTLSGAQLNTCTTINAAIAARVQAELTVLNVTIPSSDFLVQQIGVCGNALP